VVKVWTKTFVEASFVKYLKCWADVRGMLSFICSDIFTEKWKTLEKIGKLGKIPKLGQNLFDNPNLMIQ